MSQEAPFSEILERLVNACQYRPGWTLTLTHMDRGQGSKGLTLDIVTNGYSAYHPEPGLWCESCLLPSAIGYRFLLLTCKGTILKRGHVVHCHDCGQQWEPCP